MYKIGVIGPFRKRAQIVSTDFIREVMTSGSYVRNLRKGSTCVLLPVSTQKLPKTSLFLTKKSEKSEKLGENLKIDEKSGDRSTSNGSISSNNGRNVKNRVSLESSGIILCN